MPRHHVLPEEAGQRLDHLLALRSEGRSRSFIQKLIREGLVTVDGCVQKASSKVRPGQVVEWQWPPQPPCALAPEPIPLEVVYEDRHLVVINKPADMVVHPAGPVRTGTLVNALLHRYGSIDAPGGPDRPGIVHRLDKGTSGLMVVALSQEAYQKLVAQISRREVHRIYLALVWGATPEEGVVDKPVGRSVRDRTRMAVSERGKPALTTFRTRARFPLASEVEVSLHTGRTHQIRVHMAWMGHPVMGDPTYGGRRTALTHMSPGHMAEAKELLRLISRPALHAWRLCLEHPVGGGRLEFQVPPPQDYLVLREALALRAR